MRGDRGLPHPITCLHNNGSVLLHTGPHKLSGAFLSQGGEGGKHVQQRLENNQFSVTNRRRLRSPPTFKITTQPPTTHSSALASNATCSLIGGVSAVTDSFAPSITHHTVSEREETIHAGANATHQRCDELVSDSERGRDGLGGSVGQRTQGGSAAGDGPLVQHSLHRTKRCERHEQIQKGANNRQYEVGLVSSPGCSREGGG